MNRKSPLWIVSLLAGCLGPGCGADPAPTLTPVSLGPGNIPTGPAFPSPARWDYHPPAPEQAIARYPQPDGSCIVIADGGQRWQTSAPPPGGDAAARRCRGPAIASGALAPEELDGMVRLGATSWMFVGASGTLFEAADPLGPFTRAIAPPEPLSRVAGGAGAIVGLTLDGRLYRREEDSGWKPISTGGWPDLPAPSGAATASQDAGTNPAAAGKGRLPRVMDIAASDSGLLALAFPEALFASKDMGQTWTALGAPPVGAQRVGLTLDGTLAAEGVTESIGWTPDRTPSFSRLKEPLQDRAELYLSARRGPSAGAVVAGRAVLDGDRYYEVIAPAAEDGLWVLARGRMAEPLAQRPIPGTSDCDSIKLGAAGDHVLVACEQSDSTTQALRRSDDAGATWSEPFVLTAPAAELVSIAVARDGDALVTGVCKPAESTGTCKATVPLVVRLAGGSGSGRGNGSGKKLGAVVAAASELNGTAVAPAFSTSGMNAYFLGRRGKDDRLALFVSQDGGVSFAQRALDAPARSARAEPQQDEDGEMEELDEEPAADDVELAESSAIRPGDGTVGVVLRRAGGLTYLTADEDGQVLYVAAPPSDEAFIAGHGANVVATAVKSDGVFVWESRDGGATWSELPPSIAVIREVVQGAMPIACSSHGCLLGDTVSRLGWGGQSEPLGPNLPDDPPPREVPAIRTPIVCEMAASSRWVRIDNPDPSSFRAAPGVDDAMRGRSVWSVVSWDKRAQAVTLVSAMLPPSGEGEARVVSRSLLGRPRTGATIALDSSHQMEGHAVARVRLPDGDKPSGPMRDIEVAWENWMDGISGRAKIPDAGLFEPGDIEADGDRWLLQSTLLSVSPGGIFVRPHSPRSRSTLSFFLRPRGEPQKLDYPVFPDKSWQRSLDIRARELAIAAGQPLGVAIVARGAASSANVYMVAHRPQATAQDDSPVPWQVTVTALAPASVDQKLLFESAWAYSGTTLGVTSFFSDAARSRSWAYFQPFRPDGTFGPAESLPTPLDLGDEPRPCKPSQRSSTARFRAPLGVRNHATSLGTRHPVLITEAPSVRGATAGPPYELLTASAVLHGTLASPCVAAWDAIGVGQLQMKAVLPGDLSHSWAFRPAVESPPGGAEGVGPDPKQAPEPKPFALEYRPMSCRFDRMARVPESVWSEPATSRLER